MSTARVTRRELARRLDVVMQTITRWEQAGMPVDEPGRKGKPSFYVEAAVREWLASREKDARNNGTADVARDRARKERAQAILAEQTFALRAAELVRKEDVANAWAAEVSAVRAKILSWPSAWADRIYREAKSPRGLAGVVQALEDAAREALEELSKPRETPIDVSRVTGKLSAIRESLTKPGRKK